MTRPVRARLLGTFELVVDGDAVPVTGRKHQGLLAFLAVERGREHPREALATLLWGEMEHERSRHNLRQALSRIRRLHGDLLLVDDNVVSWNADTGTTDVEEFERLIADGGIDDLERGVSLYGGDLLAGVVTLEPGFDEWLRGARARLRVAVCTGIERLATLLDGDGRRDEAIACLQRRLSMDSACEAAHRQIMRLLDGSGRRSDALRQFEICKAALEREFGAAPDSETLAVRNAILATGVSQPGPSGRVERVSAERSEPPAVAVLPFENLSGEDARYLVDGLCEDLTTALSRFRALFVIARSSAFHVRDGSLTDVAEALHADYVVRGSVQIRGTALRLNVQLLDAVTGQHRWAQRFDSELEDVLVVQDEITSMVVSTLAGRVEADGIARARRLSPDRLDAYDFVLRGKDYHHRHTPEDCAKAITMFESAIERDSDYALPHAWLACCYGQQMSYTPEETWSLMERAQAAAERGRELDEDESECHRILAQVFILRRDLARAQSHQERALFLNPNDDRSVCAMGEILNLRGRPQEAERWVRKAMRLNPYHSDSYWFHLARSLFHTGRVADACDALGRITRPQTRDLVYAWAAAAGADKEAARARLFAIEPGFDIEEFIEAMPYEHEGERARLRQGLMEAGTR